MDSAKLLAFIAKIVISRNSLYVISFEPLFMFSIRSEMIIGLLLQFAEIKSSQWCSRRRQSQHKPGLQMSTISKWLLLLAHKILEPFKSLQINMFLSITDIGQTLSWVLIPPFLAQTSKSSFLLHYLTCTVRDQECITQVMTNCTLT